MKCSRRPSLQGIKTTQDVHELRHHLKFLCGDFLTAERLSRDNSVTSAQCKLCSAPVETITHVLSECRATSEVREALLPELLNTVLKVNPQSHILGAPRSPEIFTQFLLDCTSLNLPASHRIAAHHPQVTDVFQISRNWCYRISKLRNRLLCLRK